jgi:hypothetical protein
MHDSATSPPAEWHPAEVPVNALQASLCRLMTCYSLQPCQMKARTIVKILSALLQHPELRQWPPQQQIYLRLLETWGQIAAVRIPATANRNAALH